MTESTEYESLEPIEEAPRCPKCSEKMTPQMRYLNRDKQILQHYKCIRCLEYTSEPY